MDNTTIVITPRNLRELVATDKGAVTQGTLKYFGLTWPPQPGWRQQIIGRQVPAAHVEFLKELREPLSPRRDRHRDAAAVEDESPAPAETHAD